MLKKLTVSVLAVAFAFMAYAPAANAQFTTAQLEAAGFTADEIALLQAFLGGSTGSTGSSNACPVDPNSIAVGLSVGTASPDAMNVQKLMNYFAAEMGLNTQVAVTGAGSPGMETSYYGPATARAVTNFQNTYAAEILTPNGLVAGTGYYGPSTSAQVQVLCMMEDDNVPTTPTNPGDGDDDDDNDLRGGEASLEQFDLSAGDDSDVEEGQTAEVAEIEFEVEEGDVRVDRVDVTFVYTGTDTSADDEPWDVFESVSLMMDGDEVAEMDVNDEDDWLDDDGYEVESTDASVDGETGYVVRFTGLDLVVRENDEAMMTLEVTAQNSVDEADTGNVAWSVLVGDRGIRAVDSEDIQNYTGDENDVVEFTVDEEGEGEDLNVRSSSDDPDSATIKVEDDQSSDDYVIFAFELEAEDNDIELETLPVLVSVDGQQNGVTVNSVVRDAYLVIDGEEFDDYDLDTATAETGFDESRYLTFDIDKDFVVDEDEEVTVELVVEFRSANGTNYDTGASIRASVDSDDDGNADDGDIEGEGADDVVADGAATGDTHTLLTEGIAVETTDTSATRITNDGAADDQADFDLDLDVMAFEEDAFLSEDVDTSFNYSIVRANDGTVVYDSDGATQNGTAVASISTDADLEGSYYRVDEGNTEGFTLSVTYDPYNGGTAPGAGSYRLRLDSIEFEDTASAPNSTFNATPASEYRTGSVNITS